LRIAIITGTNINNTQEAKELSIKYPKYNLYFTSGVHPHDVKHLTKADFSKIEELASHPNCVAIGECGLDYNRMFSPKDKQLYWFEEHIKLAIKLNKPLFLHERDAEKDFYNLLQKYSKDIPKMVVHCFTGKLATLNKYLNLGCYIGITGWINDDRRNQDLIHALQNTEQKTLLEKIMIETDCPFLSPLNNNVLKKLSNVLQINETELEQIIYNNTLKCFKF
jgi:TatD DNase family protein